MHVIQLSRRAWLVITEPDRPRFLIVEGPLVHEETRETHVMHRVEWWHIDPRKRHVLAVLDGLVAATEWCRAELERRTAEKAALSEKLARRGF